MEIHIKRVGAVEKAAEQREEREPDSRKSPGIFSGKSGHMCDTDYNRSRKGWPGLSGFCVSAQNNVQVKIYLI